MNNYYLEKAITSSWKSISLLHEKLLPWKSNKLLHEKVFLSFMNKYFFEKVLLSFMKNYFLEKVLLSFMKNYFLEKVINLFMKEYFSWKKYQTLFMLAAIGILNSLLEFPTQLLLPETCEVSVGMNQTIKTWSC